MQSKPIVVCFLLTILASEEPYHASAAFRAPSPHQFSTQASLLRKAGYREYQAGRYREAARIYDQAYELAIAEKDWKGAVFALQNSAGVYGFLFQYRRAMEKYLTAKPIVKEMGDNDLQAMNAGNTAALYLQMGELELASAEVGEALKLIPLGVPAPGRTSLLGNAAETRAIQKRFDEALPLFSQAIEAAGELADLSAETKIRDHLGEALRQSGHIQEAEDVLIENYRLRLMAKSPLLPVSWVKLGYLRLDQGRPIEAERFLTMALERSRTAGNSVPRWRTLLARGRARSAQGRSWQALNDFRAARDDVRRWRLEVAPADAVRVSANAGLAELYEEYTALAAQLYAVSGSRALLEESLLAMEENRGASLRESIAGSSRRLPQEYWETLARLRLGSAGPDSSQSAALRLRLSEMEIQAGLPEPAGADADRTVRSMQSRLGCGECLIGFVLSKKVSQRWSLTRDRAFLHELPRRADVSAVVRAFSAAVREGRPEASELGGRLYQMLLGTLPAACRSKIVWKLALDDELFEAPFAALQTGGRYLIETHQLEILPSTWMTIPARRGFSERFAGFGDPVYNRADERLAKRGAGQFLLAAQRGAEPELSRLPGSRTEVESCARSWSASGLPQSVVLGANVNRDRVAQALEDRPAVLHLATHVIPSPGDPGNLALAFGFARDGAMELMSARDMSRYRTDLGLVTLSGCASGSGPVREGAGLMGLTRGWLLAGARSVVASYWPVLDDEGRLFKEFYGELASAWTGQGRFCPAAALRKSQLFMLRSQGFQAEPRQWAAYFTVSRGLPE